MADPPFLTVSQRLAKKNLERKSRQTTEPPPPPLNPHSTEHDAEGVVVLYERSGCIVKRYLDGTVVKSGTDVKPEERSALDLAAQLGLPVPRVHDASNDPFTNVFSMRMDYVEGKTLDKLWPTMSEDEKQAICQQLREILVTMRSIQWTTGAIGSCSGGQVRDLRRYGYYDGGPFLNQAEFNQFYCDFPDTIPRPLRQAFSQKMRTDYRIVFSHGDLSQHNIIIKDGRIEGLMDWEFAGWYPEHWEYIKFFERPALESDWKDRGDEIFSQAYHDELALYQGISRWQKRP